MLPLDDAERDQVVSRADVVVAGVGDCGGCTACTVTDALRCLERGTPAFAVVTDRFVEVADSTEQAYGLAGLRRLTVDHPIWTRDHAWFDATGAAVADAIVTAVWPVHLQPAP
jgi:hypothetical protein